MDSKLLSGKWGEGDCPLVGDRPAACDFVPSRSLFASLAQMCLGVRMPGRQPVVRANWLVARILVPMIFLYICYGRNLRLYVSINT
jgi:hypothetical protein